MASTSLLRGPCGVAVFPFRLPAGRGRPVGRLAVVVRWDLFRPLPGRFTCVRIGLLRVGVALKRRRAGVDAWNGERSAASRTSRASLVAPGTGWDGASAGCCLFTRVGRSRAAGRGGA